MTQITRTFADSRQTSARKYLAPQIHAEMRDADVRCGRKRRHSALG